MSGTIYYSEEVPVYLDANCSILMPSVYNWGILTNGISKNIWVKNIGDVAVNVSIEVLNPLNCYINVSPSNLALIVGKVEEIDLSIEVYGEPSDVVSWGLKVSAEKA